TLPTPGHFVIRRPDGDRLCGLSGCAAARARRCLGWVPDPWRRGGRRRSPLSGWRVLPVLSGSTLLPVSLLSVRPLLRRVLEPVVLGIPGTLSGLRVSVRVSLLRFG